MNIIITAKNFKLTDGIKLAVNEALKKFENFVTDEEQVKVTLEDKKYGQKIEVTLPINNRLMKAESTADSLYIAIDLVADKLKRQIDKYSKRLYNTSTESIRFAEEEYNDQEEEQSKIVKRKYFSAKPMSEEEAILQMELLGHLSFMFFNDDTDSICMLYKRNDGDYGIIMTE